MKIFFKKNIAIITGVVSVIIVASIMYAFVRENNQEVSVFNEFESNLVIDDKQVNVDNKISLHSGEIMMEFNTIKEYIDKRIFFDKKNKVIVITTGNELILLKIGSKQVLINDESIDIGVAPYMKTDEVYCPIKFLSKYYKIKVDYIDELKLTIVDNMKMKSFEGKLISGEVKIRKGPSKSEPIVKKMNNEQDLTVKIFVNESNDTWLKVRTNKGYIGYIKKDNLQINSNTKDDKDEELDSIEEKNIIVEPVDNKKLIMVWEMAYNKNTKYQYSKGLDVVLPTWFQLSNEKGGLITRAYKEYVDNYHKSGVKVWALVSNSMENRTLTGNFLENTNARHEFIKKLNKEIKTYNIDGLNIDFESISTKNRSTLIQFIREVTSFFKERDITISVDIPVPDGGDRVYNTEIVKEIGEIADYAIMMGYDQHWSGSKVAGSVAEASWVEGQLVKVLNNIPKEKLILGIPFYTRLWEEKTNKNGQVSVSGKVALTISGSKSYLQKKNVNMVWMKKSGQLYAEFVEGDTKYKVWVEDENSLDIKSSFIHKYNIKGVSAWSKGFETYGVWDVLFRNLKKFKSYDEWSAVYTERKINYSQ